jgi:hypothetical protein
MLPRSVTAIAGTLFLMMFVQVGAMAQQDSALGRCKVTLPSADTGVHPASVPATKFGIGADGRVAIFGTDQLWTVLPVDGTWRGSLPNQPGDYAYSNKLPWGGTFSYKGGPLRVTGRRLDGPAPSFTEIEPISWEHEFMGGINIPVFGCWEVTGQYKDHQLRFVVWVTPIQQQRSQISQDQGPKSALRRVHLEGETEEKSLVYRITPETPHEAKVANISGTVVLDAVIGIDGRPHKLRYVSGPAILAQAAIEAATWSQYRVDEENLEVDTTIRIDFPPSRGD